ncbi:unnamed protein product [Nezara viridula]|uniref:Uncharacterized protein n=1 Tax=Nezara viridula TaxID=85310 RepID=A0A9P0GWN6_NEZVI|nr:unnamed protein product [Nezara viridula]
MVIFCHFKRGGASARKLPSFPRRSARVLVYLSYYFLLPINFRAVSLRISSLQFFTDQRAIYRYIVCYLPANINRLNAFDSCDKTHSQ